MSQAPPPLPRSLGTMGILFLTLSATTPASSLFVIVPGMVQVAGAGALAAMALAGLVCLATAFLYAELSSAFPNAGGEYVMVARTLGPLPGFVILVVNLVNNMLFPPVVGLGLSAVLAGLFPGLPAVPVAVLVVAGACGSALLAIRTNALVTGLFLLLEVATLAGVAVLGVGHAVRPVLAPLIHPQVGLAAIGTATTVAIFALNGYGMAVYFGEEMRDAARRIGRVVLLSFALSFALEVVPLAAALAGAADPAGFARSADPFGDLLGAIGGRWVAGAAAIGVATAIVNAAVVTVLASSRFLYATARDGVWGEAGGRVLGQVSARFAVPWAATLAVGAIGIACCWISLSFLTVLSGAGLVVTYLSLAIAAWAGRTTGMTAHARYRMPLFPLAPLVTLLALAGVVWASWLDRQEGRPGLIATAAQMAGAVLWYAWRVRRRGRWRPADPVGTEPAAVGGAKSASVIPAKAGMTCAVTGSAAPDRRPGR